MRKAIRKCPYCKQSIPRVIKVCPQCKQEFQVDTTNKRQKFCKRACQDASLREKKTKAGYFAQKMRELRARRKLIHAKDRGRVKSSAI
jgi:predicted amidophosphoribosyltransferase